MDAPIQPAWQELFRANTSAASSTVSWRVLRKSGEPLLVLPDSPPAAIKALQLYPAQSAKARMLKKMLRTALKWNLPLPWARTNVTFDSAAPFAKFLAAQAGTKQFPGIGIFAGNPRTSGRRFILLLFDERNQPRGIVKAGLGETAGQLIEREQKFLASVPATVAGIPKVLGTFRDENLAAFAMSFFEGDPASTTKEMVVQTLVNTWANTDRSVKITETVPWKELEEHCLLSARFEKPGSWLAARDAMFRRIAKWPPVRGVLFHGDLAPWNLQLNRATGQVVALDWERGQLCGVPGWDWFHFKIQTGILVKKLSPTALRDDLENLLRSEEFLAYANRCGIAGGEHDLALAYLYYNIYVLRPSEGGESIRALIELISNSWISGSKS